MEYLEISNLKKEWKSSIPSQNFTLSFSCSVKKGSMLGIVGQSGSGKSTVLRLISGLMECDKNQNEEENCKILIDGKDISNLAPAKRKIGIVFQSPSLFPHLRVDDNVAYGLRYGNTSDNKNYSKAQARLLADEYLEKFNMKDFALRFPSSLSGGEAQRVSLARTLIIQPNLVLFDEPFSALDAPLRKKLAADIKKMQVETGFTGILVTHDINEVKTLCDTVTVLNKGKQTWTGSPNDFTENLLLQN